VSASACRFSSIPILILMLLAGAAQGQSRIAMPTMIAQEAPAGTFLDCRTAIGQRRRALWHSTHIEHCACGGNMISPPTTTVPAPATPYAAPVRSAVAPASPAPQTYVTPGTGYGPPGSVSPFNPSATAPPTGAYAGTLPPPSPGLDPYATPGNAPAPLFAQDPYFNYGAPAIPFNAMTKFLQDIRMDYHWFLGHGQKELGINDFDLSATFAIPIFGNPNTPLLIHARLRLATLERAGLGAFNAGA